MQFTSTGLALTRRHALAALAATGCGSYAHALTGTSITNAPNFVLPSLQGQTIALERLRGAVVWLDFWASWCPPCARSFPWMQSMQAQWGAQGLEVIAINVDRRAEDALNFLKKFGSQLAVAFDAQGNTARSYQVKVMPTAFLIDRQGVVRHIHTGFKDSDGADLSQLIIQWIGK